MAQCVPVKLDPLVKYSRHLIWHLRYYIMSIRVCLYVFKCHTSCAQKSNQSNNNALSGCVKLLYNPRGHSTNQPADRPTKQIRFEKDKSHRRKKRKDNKSLYDIICMSLVAELSAVVFSPLLAMMQQTNRTGFDDAQMQQCTDALVLPAAPQATTVRLGGNSVSVVVFFWKYYISH